MLVVDLHAVQGGRSQSTTPAQEPDLGSIIYVSTRPYQLILTDSFSGRNSFFLCHRPQLIAPSGKTSASPLPSSSVESRTNPSRSSRGTKKVTLPRHLRLASTTSPPKTVVFSKTWHISRLLQRPHWRPFCLLCSL